MAKEARKGRDHPDAKAMQEQRGERDKANLEAMKRMDSSKPTPTQEENDLAKLGIQVDEKEDDGSGPTVITHNYVANVPLGYDTRSMIPQPAPTQPAPKSRDERREERK